MYVLGNERLLAFKWQKFVALLDRCWSVCDANHHRHATPHSLWQFLIVSKRGLGTAGDEKGGVWLYSTDSNSTADTGYSLAQQRQLFHFWYLALCSFLKTVWRVQIFFASPQKSALFDNACVLKTDPCRPTKTPTTMHKHEQRISRTLALLTRT